MHGQHPTAPRPAARFRRYAPDLAVAFVLLCALVSATACGQPRTVVIGTPTATAPTETPADGTVVASEATPEATRAPTSTPSATAPATATSTSTTEATAEPGATEPTASPTATETAQPSATAPSSTAAGLRIEVDPATVGQGETMLVRVPGVAGGTVLAGGRAYPLLPGDGEAWAVVGIQIDADLGVAALVARPRDRDGVAMEERTTEFTVSAVGRPVDYLTLTEEQGSVLTPEAGVREVEIRGQQFATFDSAPRWTGPFVRPIEAEHFETTQFGQGRSINGGPVGGFHTGLDLAADEGIPVLASAPGRVTYADAMPIRGNSVLVDHGGGVVTGYHHLSEIAVSVGETVEAGTRLGALGATGLATGPHLHWELTIYGVNVDPETWTARTFRP
ncbi:MAG: M23 family metallopeptidase [Dehalococcoidia bacterium]